MTALITGVSARGIIRFRSSGRKDPEIHSASFAASHRFAKSYGSCGAHGTKYREGNPKSLFLGKKRLVPVRDISFDGLKRHVEAATHVFLGRRFG